MNSNIDNLQQQQCGGEDWQACLDSFKIGCRDVGHDTRCAASESPTWPRVRLVTSTYFPDVIVLNLEWTPLSPQQGFYH